MRALCLLVLFLAACDDAVQVVCADGAACYPTQDGYRLVQAREPCGVCAHAGTLDCSTDKCVGATPPSAELCNGLDDDCDCEVDEDTALEADDPRNPCGSLCGPCTQSEYVCVRGTRVCSIRPEPEECNGVDDDCDCEVDEIPPLFSYSGPPTALANPPCRPRVVSCENGVEVTIDEVLPTSEDVCYNGLDDDCDGQIDEADSPFEPRSIALLLDLSGSMHEELQDVVRVVCDYADTDPPDTYMAVVGIAVNSPPSGIAVLRDFAIPLDTCLSLMTLSLSAGADEHQTDAFVIAATTLEWPSDDRAAVIFTDEDSQPDLYGSPSVRTVCAAYGVDLYVATDPLYFFSWSQMVSDCGGETADLNSYSDLLSSMVRWFQPECAL